MKQRQKDLCTAYLFLLPAVILLLVLILYPLVRSIHLSFLNASFVNRNPQFVGLKNYIKIFESGLFWKVLKNSVIWTVVVVGFQFFFGLTFALFLNKIVIARNLFRSLLLVPWVVPGVIVGVIWKIMYNPQVGLVNALLLKFGIIADYTAFLADERTALLAVIVVAVWKGFPFSVVIYLAALQSVRVDLLDAAMIDGANFLQRLRYVIIPEITEIIRITLLLTTIWTFNYFDIIYAMTNGGPNKATQIFPLEIYEQAFRQFRFSYAAAIAVIALLGILFVSLFYVRELRKREAL
ncbi:MAG: sugar ABC transporter permease [Candidatus Vecturithrix sp.]|nr:sugar ABC transporter permease [Candidatus Vecturithrix sp.]